MKITTFDMHGKGTRRFGLSLPSSRPHELQLVFVRDEEQLVVCLPSENRLGLAMRLLEADGMRAMVTLTAPRVAKPAKKARKKGASA